MTKPSRTDAEKAVQKANSIKAQQAAIKLINDTQESVTGETSAEITDVSNQNPEHESSVEPENEKEDDHVSSFESEQPTEYHMTKEQLTETIRNAIEIAKKEDKLKEDTKVISVFNSAVISMKKKVDRVGIDKMLSQQRQPNFTLDVITLMDEEVKRAVDLKFVANNLCVEDGWLLWDSIEILNQLRLLYPETGEEDYTDIQQKLEEIAKTFSLGDTEKETLLFAQMLKICDEMTQEQIKTVSDQDSWIKLFSKCINSLDPIKNELKSLKCATLKKWIYALSSILVTQDKAAIELRKRGYTVTRVGFDNVVKKRKSSEITESVGKNQKPKKAKEATTNIPKLDYSDKSKMCRKCGRISIDKTTNKPHTEANCPMDKHPNINTDKTKTFPQSIFGIKFLTLTPPVTFLGLKIWNSKNTWDFKNKKVITGNVAYHSNDIKMTINYQTNNELIACNAYENSCINCEYLSKISTNKKSNNDYLSVSLSLQFQDKQYSEQIQNVATLLDTGNLGSNFISQELVDRFRNSNQYVSESLISRKVCSGLDNRCYNTDRYVTLKIVFKNEVTNKMSSFETKAYIILTTNLDIIICRNTIKKERLIHSVPSHFGDLPENALQCSGETPPGVRSETPCADVTCGCQRQPVLLPAVFVSPKVRDVKEITNRHDEVTLCHPLSILPSSRSCSEETIEIPMIETRNQKDTTRLSHTDSLMAVAQTHALTCTSRKIDTANIDRGSKFQNKADMLIDTTTAERKIQLQSIFAAYTADITDHFIDNDLIDNIKTDTFSPWLPDKIVSNESTDILDSIHVEGSEQLQKGIRLLLEKFRHIFANVLPATAALMTPFELIVDQVKWRQSRNRGPPRIQTPKKQAEIASQVSELLRQGIIQKSNAAYYSQVILAPKPNDEWRLCVDYRNLNDCTESASWPIPNIRQMLMRIGQHRSSRYGVMDLCQGYHQNEVSINTRVFTAFIIFMGIYEFLRLPFGPKRAPSHFQEQMASVVLLGLIYLICEIYLDDVIVHGNTDAQFLERLELVFLRFEKHKIILKPKKCKFGLPAVEYVGKVISSEGLTLSLKKRLTVTNFPIPQYAKEVKSFLGLANYFRDHVPNHSDVVRPLQNLIPDYKRSNKINWNGEAKIAFEHIKQLINDCPTMFFLTDSDPIYLHTDASDYGIGGYLFQVIDNSERPVAFVSKSLSKTQLRWPIIQKEAYAIFRSVVDLDYLLRDSKFTIRTDHKNLLYIKDSSNPMIIRWYMAIQELDYRLEEIEGKKNIVADDFSRLCPNLMKDSPDEYDNADIVCSVLQKFRLSNDEYAILSTVHNSTVGHFQVERTVKRLLRLKLKWKFLRQKVKKFIQECPCCQKMSQIKIPIAAHPFSASTFTPMECLNIDFIGPYPDKGYIMVIIDTFTRWVELYLSDDATAVTAAANLLNHFGRYGSPAQLRSDRGPHFIADLIKEFTSLIGTDLCLTLAYSKEENAIVERANKEVNRHLIALTFDKSTAQDYKLCVPFVQRIINSNYNEITKISPAEMLFGNALDLDRSIFLPAQERNASVLEKPLSAHTSKMLSIQDNLIKIARDQLQFSDRNRIGYYPVDRTAFAKDSYVLVKYRTGNPPTRLHTKWRGPMRVISNNFNNYTLRDLINHKDKIYHVTDLRVFHFDPIKTDTQDVARKDYLEYFIEEVLSHRGNVRYSSQLEFKIKWLGYEEDKNSWEPWKILRDTEKLHTYLRLHGLAKLIPKKFTNSAN